MLISSRANSEVRSDLFIRIGHVFHQLITLTNCVIQRMFQSLDKRLSFGIRLHLIAKTSNKWLDVNEEFTARHLLQFFAQLY